LSEAQGKLTSCQEALKAKQKLRADAESAAADREKAASVVDEKLKSMQEEHEKEKKYLIKRAQDVEGRLKSIIEELTSLKKHIFQMTQAVFGKSPCHLSW
jgi:hypothetical protein